MNNLDSGSKFTEFSKLLQSSILKKRAISFLVMLTIVLVIPLGDFRPVPASADVIESLDFTVWTNGVSFTESMIIELSLDLSVLLNDPVTITIRDQNGSFLLIDTINDPVYLTQPQIFFKNVESSQIDSPGIHYFEIVCSQLSNQMVRHFPIFLNMDTSAVMPITGIQGGLKTMEIVNDLNYYVGDRGQHLTVNMTLKTQASPFPCFYFDAEKESLIYLKKDAGNGLYNYFYPLTQPEGIFTSLNISIDFRLPLSWDYGENTIQPVFTGCTRTDLLYDFGDSIVINTVSGLGLWLDATSDTVERNNLTQNNKIDYTVMISSYAGQNYRLKANLTDVNGLFVEQVLDTAITRSIYIFSYSPDYFIDLGDHTLTIYLLEAGGNILDEVNHTFTIVDRLIISDFWMNSSLIQPGEGVFLHYSVREEDNPVPAECNTIVRADWNNSDTWDTISDQNTAENGNVDIEFGIPESSQSARIRLRIEIYPFSDDKSHISSVFTRYINLVTDTIISHTEPLKVFRGTEVYFEAAVYNEYYQPVTSGTLSLFIGTSGAIVFHRELNSSNWDSISIPWIVPNDYETGIESFYWDYSGNDYNLPITSEFNVAIWSTPHVDELNVNNSALISGEPVKISAKVIDETYLTPNRQIEVKFDVVYEGTPTRSISFLSMTNRTTGIATIVLTTSDTFFERGNYIVKARTMADEVNCIAESLHQEERRFTVTTDFVILYDDKNVPVIEIPQNFTIRGRSNAVLVLHLTYPNGSSQTLRQVILDVNGYYHNNITFHESGNYTLYVVPENPEDLHVYTPLELEVFGIQNLLWNLDSVPSKDLIFSNNTVIYLNLTTNQALNVIIETDGPFNMYLNGSLTLHDNKNRSFSYNFTQRGIYILSLQPADPTAWLINRTCIITVLEVLDTEFNIPTAINEDQTVIAGITITSRSEGGVRGIIIDLILSSNESTEISFKGSTDQNGMRNFQIENLTAGIYAVWVKLTLPEGSFFSVNHSILAGHIKVWSSTIIQVNPFVVKTGSTKKITATVKSHKGTPLADIPLIYYYYNDTLTNTTLIGSSTTNSSGIAEIAWLVTLSAGSYFMVVETNTSWPFENARQSISFEVTGDVPKILNFGIHYMGNDSAGELFLATVEVRASNSIESVTLEINRTSYHLSANPKGSWQVLFYFTPGIYSLKLSVVDVYGYSDFYEIADYQLLNTLPDESNGDSDNSAGTTSNNTVKTTENQSVNLAEAIASIVLIASGGIIAIVRKRYSGA